MFPMTLGLIHIPGGDDVLGYKRYTQKCSTHIEEKHVKSVKSERKKRKRTLNVNIETHLLYEYYTRSSINCFM